MTSTSLVWLRNDLRLSDNPALSAAVQHGESARAIYIHETTDGMRAPGGAARWWLHHSLTALGAALAEQGIALDIVQGDAAKLLPAYIAQQDIGSVFWNRRYGRVEREADAALKGALREDGRQVESFAANLLLEPWDIKTQQGQPYSVFTPFWKSLRERAITRPLAAPSGGTPLAKAPKNDVYDRPEWADKLTQHWTIGEAGAQAALTAFLDGPLDDYPEGRDFPGREVTSRLSPHLRFGEISPRQIWHAAQALAHADHTKQAAINKFLSELAWRDFSYHQLFHRDDIAKVPMQGKYRDMPWRHAKLDVQRWQKGQTGLPIIDAGMRELWATGYMHNRVRMLVASLLTKNLLIDWRVGEQWFWDCLVDADEANNPASWQWVAGSGMDAAPYFRIFNPVTQGERFDAQGLYVRQWVPELAKVPDKWIHEPANAPADVLRTAGVEIGKTYPAPIVDLKLTRTRALDAAKEL